MDDMKEITIKIPRPFYNRMILFVESEYQKSDGRFSKEALMDSLLAGWAGNSKYLSSQAK